MHRSGDYKKIILYLSLMNKYKSYQMLKQINQGFRRFLIYGLLISFCSFYSLSCKKSNDASEHSFKWTFRDTTYTTKSDTAFLSGSSSMPILVASDKTNVNYLNVRVSITAVSFNEGRYNFGENNNRLRYTDNQGYILAGGSGVLNIMPGKNSLLSESFSVTVIQPYGPTHTITGNSLTDTPIKQ